MATTQKEESQISNSVNDLARSSSDVWRSKFYFLQHDNKVKVRNKETKEEYWKPECDLFYHEKVILFPNYERADWIGGGNDITYKYNKSLSANLFDRVDEYQLSDIKFGGHNVLLNKPMRGILHSENVTFMFLKIVPDKAVEFLNNAVIYVYCIGTKEVTDTQLSHWVEL